MKFSVGELVSLIKENLEGTFRDVTVVGEVCNFKGASTSGHFYFSLKDRDAMISCACFRYDAMRIPALRTLKVGEKVVVKGRVGVYAKSGTFQIIASDIRKAGEGDLHAEFEELKRRLQAEGLFDMDHKRKIPAMPKRVGIITALSAAALQDFLNIFDRRSIFMDILISPSLMQGDTAPASVVAALHRLIAYDMQAPDDQKLDVIVIARGGGSYEDLFCFNDEGLAYEIYNSPIPIISAIGHEIDFTISDFVADLRAETPSAAAELLTTEAVKILDRLEAVKRGLERYGDFEKFDYKLENLKYRLQNLKLFNFSDLNQQLDNAIDTLSQAVQNRVVDYSRRIETAHLHLTNLGIFNFSERSTHLENIMGRIKNAVTTDVLGKRHRLDKSISVLNALDPNNVLKRGYSIVKLNSGEILDSTEAFDQAPSQAELTVCFRDGERHVVKK